MEHSIKTNQYTVQINVRLFVQLIKTLWDDVQKYHFCEK